MDNFKDVNDRYGHLVGDETLRNIGHLLRSSIRAEDEAFRWGGDEFVILFHNQNQEVARNRRPAARFPRARLRRAVDLVQLGRGRSAGPLSAGHRRRCRPADVHVKARTEKVAKHSASILHRPMNDYYAGFLGGDPAGWAANSGWVKRSRLVHLVDPVPE